MLHCHATAAVAVAAMFTAVVLTLWDMRAPRSAFRRFIVASALAGALGLPVLVAMAMQSGSQNIYWLPRFGLEQIIILNRYLLVGPMARSDLGDDGSRALLLAEMGIGTLTAILLFAAGRRSIRDRRAMALVLTFPLIYVVLMSGISVLRPVLIPRVALWVSGPICLTVAFILVDRGAVVLRAAAVTLFAACVAIGLFNNVIAPAEHKPDWRAFMRDNPPTDSAGPLLVAGPHAAPLALVLYAQDDLVREVRQWIANPALPTTLAERIERTTAGAQTIGTDDLVALIRSGRHVRLYLDGDDEVLIKSTLTQLAEFASATRQDYPGLIVFTW
jgi:hypothetical protein